MKASWDFTYRDSCTPASSESRQILDSGLDLEEPFLQALELLTRSRDKSKTIMKALAVYVGIAGHEKTRSRNPRSKSSVVDSPSAD